MSRRSFTIALIIVLLPAVALIRVAMKPAVGWEEFEQRMDAFFEGSGFKVMATVTEDAQSVPLPFYQRMRSILPWRGSGVKFATGFPDSVLRWHLARVEGLAFQILVRYHEGNAVRMVICSSAKHEKDRRDLKNAIAKLFPYLEITFEDRCPPERARTPQPQ